MANKKVSQLTSKPAVNLTDLFLIADPTSGQAFKTTISDLGTAIGSGVSSVNTLVGAVVLDTDDIQELASPTNRWYTDTRSRAAISGGTGISYDSGTGVITNAVTSGQIATALGYTPADGANYLPLAGGTMGGAIFGTTATFASSTSVTALGITLSGASGDGVKITHSAGRAFNLQSSGSGYGILINNATASTSAPFTIQKQGLDVITLTDAGAGSFASSLTASSFIRSSGTSSQFLKADGSVDSSTYLTTGTAASTYLPLTGGTLTGNLNGTNITITNSLIAKGGTFNGGASAAGIVTIDGLSSNVLMNRTDTDNGTLISFLTNAVEMWHIGMRSGGTDNFVIYNSNLLANAVSVNISNSAVTLAGALNGTSATFSDTADITANNSTAINLVLRGRAADSVGQMEFWNNAKSTRYGYIATDSTSMGVVTTQAIPLVLGTNSTVRLTIATTGAATFSSSVTAGSGTSSGYATLNLIDSGTGSARYASIRKNYDSPFDLRIRASNSESAAPIVFDLSNAAEAMRITSAGNVGIGTTSPTTYSLAGRHLELNDAGGGYSFFHNCTTTVKSFYAINESALLAALFTFSNHSLTFGTNNTERMRITSGGNVLVGTTSDGGYKLDVSGKTRVNSSDGFFIQSGSQYRQMYFDGFSTLYFWNGSNQANLSSAGAWVNASDAAIKKDVTPIKYGLSDLMLLNPRSYKMKTDDLEQIGFIAQEVEQVIPEVVNSDNKGMKGLSYGNMIALLTKSIQELKAELDTLKNK
jgi:hypothetical protein